jgi:Ca2+-binding EF-hand superfamily protein
MVQQGGVSAASASMSADKLFSQANMGSTKQISLSQFLDLFNTEKNIRGMKSANETLSWFEALVAKLPPVYHHRQRNSNQYLNSHTPIHNNGATTHEDIEIRADALFKQIDTDDSGLISRRELELLMVQQGGSSAATASMSADKLFSQANMGNARQISKEQFLHLFTTEKRLRGPNSANETLSWFESLVAKLPPSVHHQQQDHQHTGSVSPPKPVWFEKPVYSNPPPSSLPIPINPVNSEVGVPEERPNTAVRNVAARAEARRKARESSSSASGGGGGGGGVGGRHAKKRPPEAVHKTGGFLEHYENAHPLEKTVDVKTLPRATTVSFSTPSQQAKSSHQQHYQSQDQSLPYHQYQAPPNNSEKRSHHLDNSSSKHQVQPQVEVPAFVKEVLPPNLSIPAPPPINLISSNDTPAPVTSKKSIDNIEVQHQQKQQPVPLNKVSNRRRSNRNGKNLLETTLSGDVRSYKREGKDGQRVFHLAGCDSRMEVAFKRIDIDGGGKVSRRELLSHMEICREQGGEAGISPSTSAFECVENSQVKVGGIYELEDFAHLFRAEKEARGEASSMAMLQWFEMLANRLPPTVAMQRIDEEERNMSPANPGSFMPSALEDFEIDNRNGGDITPLMFTTPPTTAVSKVRTISSSTSDDVEERKDTDRASHSPHPNKQTHLVDKAATEALGDRLEQVASRAEARKQKKREILYERAESLYYTMVDLKHECLLGPTSWGSKQYEEEGITVADLVELIMSSGGSLGVQKVQAVKNATDIFKQAGVDTETYLTAESLVQYARKEIALRGDRSCDDMLRSFEGLCSERAMARDPSKKKSSHSSDDDDDMSAMQASYQETTPNHETTTTKNIKQQKENQVDRDIDPNKGLSTSIELKQEIMKSNKEHENEWWKAEDNVEGEEDEECVEITIMKGAAEEEAKKSLRKESSFNVPKLHGTPHGQDDIEEEDVIFSQDVASSEKSLPQAPNTDIEINNNKIVTPSNESSEKDDLVIVTRLGDEDDSGPGTARAITAPSPTANSGDIPLVPSDPSSGYDVTSDLHNQTGDISGLSANQSPSSTSVNSDNTTSASDKATRLTKAAAVARAHYLRMAVDPVFVPLLDAVVFHKPRDVTTFVAERCLKDLLARGTDAEKEVVRAMMKRLLDDDDQ